MDEINKKKNTEKGGITLYVLLACLFFVFILAGVYISNLNKLQVQEKQVSQVEENYRKQLDEIDEIYEELSSNIVVTLNQEPENDIWTNQDVKLTGNAEIKTGSKVITGHAFAQENTNIDNITWVQENSEKQIARTSMVGENSTYYFFVKDNEGNPYYAEKEVKNIDKKNPVAGTIKLEDSAGNLYNGYEINTSESVYITELINGYDVPDETGKTGMSGHKITTITISKNGKKIDKWTNIQLEQGEKIELTDGGTYSIQVITEDNAGNKSDDADGRYTIKINKIVPILALKHNNEDGQEYESGTWTKDDLYGEVTIEPDPEGKKVEKYQYSYNGVIWNDISSEAATNSINYTTTFPMAGEKPEWIKGPINADSKYYFTTQSDGTIKSNNRRVSNSTAKSYFEIDLTDFPGATLEVTLRATISSETNSDYGYMTVVKSDTVPTNPPEYDEQTGRFAFVSGTTRTANHKTTLTGGSKYYLYIGYRKDGMGNGNQDSFTINNITLKSEELSKGMNFYDYNKIDDKVTFMLKDEIDKEMYIRAVYTGTGEISKNGAPTSIKIDKTPPVIVNKNITVSKTDIQVKEDGSGFRGYYISTETIKPTETSEWIEPGSKEFSIEGLRTNTTYHLWLIDNVGNISEDEQIQMDNVNYEIDGNKYTITLEQAIEAASDGSKIKLLNDYFDESTATFSKNVEFNIQGYTLTRDKTITINTSKSVQITGTGKITSGETAIRTITNNGTLTLNNSFTLENMSSTNVSDSPIYNNNNRAIINVNDNVKIIGYYKGIYNYNGRVNVNGGNIQSTTLDSRAYGIYNPTMNSKIYIKDGEVKGYYGIYNYNSSALVEMTGGKVVGIGADGIYAGGETKIYAGRIEGKTYGVEGQNTNKLTIGKEEDPLSTTIPAIYGANYGIYMDEPSYTFNFYNGVIISNTRDTAFRGSANLRRNHMTHTFLDYEVEQKYCTILVPIPDDIIMEATPTTYTNGNVRVRITYPLIEGATKQYSEDNIEWKDADSYVQDVIVTENKIVYARMLNESGIVIKENQLEVNNIDKEKPVVKVEPTKTTYDVLRETDTADITLTITATDTGVSGLDIVQYAWATEGEKPEFVDFSDKIIAENKCQTTISNKNLRIGTYNLYINVTDRATNKADLTQIRYNVRLREPVARIGDTLYLTVQEAVEACSKNAGDTQTTITMIRSTDEEFHTYEGQNIILDLNGKTIGSSSQEEPICKNDAILQIVDTSAEKTGKLESLNGTAIDNNGTFTLGDNSDSIDFERPTIYGKQTGIKNDGTLKFFDGQIQGTTPVDGSVTETPRGYGPVSTDYTDGITTVKLGIVLGYEARIQWIYYTTLQDAIDATQIYQNDNRDTVTLVKDIQLSEIAQIIESRNIVLDLYGYKLTIAEKDRIIHNQGNVKIVDTSEEQTGQIEMSLTSSSYGVYNEKSGTVEMAGGTINSKSYGIYNEKSGTVRVTGGKINSTNTGIGNASTGLVEIAGGIVTGNNYTIHNINDGIIRVTNGTVNGSNYGIYNESIGKVEVTGGTIDIKASGNYSYAISNASTGTIEVTNGDIISNGRYSYGIHNTGTGTAQIKGGEINSTGSYSYGAYNGNTGTIEVTGGTINGASYGIYNGRTGNIKVTGGAIQSGNSGIYNYSTGLVEVTGGMINSSNIGIYNYTTGTIIIGDKEDKIISKENPKIRGNYTGTSTTYNGYGVHNVSGYMEFYNGIIQGSTSALLGNTTKIGETYKIEQSTIEGYDSIYLVKNSNTRYVAQVEGKKYYTLGEAINSISDNEEKTIQILRSFELDEVIEFNKKITLDLNGYTITNNYYRIENTNSLKIIDTTTGKLGKIENLKAVVGIYNKETAIIEIASGTLDSSSNTYTHSYGIYNDNGEVKISGGTVNCSNSYSYNSSSNYSYGIYNKGTGTVEMTSGTINSGISNDTNNSFSYSYGIYNESTGTETVKMTNGMINSICSGNQYGTARRYSYGIYNANSGEIQIDGATVSSTSGSSNYSYSYGIYNKTTGKIQISEGNISSNSSSNSYGIYNEGTGEIEVTGGSVTSGSSNGATSGIHNVARGTVIVGIKGDGLVSQEYPYIKGEYTGTTSNSSGKYGIYNMNGDFYFYDGKLEGTTEPVHEVITEREENTELVYSEDKTILTLSTTLTDVARIGSTTYKKLQDAINTVGTSGTATEIELLRNVTYTNQDEVITISKNQNIKLNIMGHKIVSAIPETLIQNAGTLEITGNEEGTLISNTENTIKNLSGAKLTISQIMLENRTRQVIQNEGQLIVESGKIERKNGNNDYNYAIFNNGGTIEAAGGIISSEGSSSYAIYNEGTGRIKVTGGTVVGNGSSSYGIYNKSTGNIKVVGGEVNSSGTSSYAIYNEGTGLIEVTGGSVNGNGSSSYGIYNGNSGNVQVTNGIVKGSSNAIYNGSKGTITIGTKSDGKVVQEYPIIESTLSNAIYNQDGIFQYYDGTIKGIVKAIYGNITELEDLTELKVSTESTTEIVNLEQKTTNAVSVNGTQYDSIQKAIKSCGTTESTIKVLRNIGPNATITIESGQNITIDLNGYTVNNYQEITNNGTLKIIDNSSSHNGKMIGISGTAITNKGTMELNGGEITQSGYGIQNMGNLTINGGSLKNNTYGIYNTDRTVTVISGEINSNTYGIYNYNGTVNVISTGIANNTYGIYNNNGNLNIKEGAEIQSNTGIYNESGTLNIGESGNMNEDSPIITGEEYGIVNRETAIVYMHDGQIRGRIGATHGFITYTERGYMIANRTEKEYNIDYLAPEGTISTVARVNGIDFSNLQSAINSIIGEDTQTITLTNGIVTSADLHIYEGQNIILDMNGKTIESALGVTLVNEGTLIIIDSSGKDVAKISSTTGTAINNSGTLILGEDDGIMKINLIAIEGKTEGIVNTGTLSFYDGTISGTSAVQGIITKRATGYVIRSTTVNQKEMYYLSK